MSSRAASSHPNGAALSVRLPRRPTVTVLSIAVRGRLRVRVSAVRGRPAAAAALEDALGALAAVRDVQASPLTGSVLVHFDASRLRARDLVGRIAGQAAVPATRATPRAPAPAWHALSPEAVLAGLDVVPEKGLATAEAARRLASAGSNRLPATRPRSAAAILAHHL